MKRISIQFIAKSAILAALYAALTWLLQPISYGPIQFRISELLILLVAFNPKYAFAMIIGCFVANLTSPLGWYDMLFGTLATALAVLPMIKIKKLPISALFPVISNALIVSVELGLAFDMFAPGAFWFNVLTVGIGEAVVLYLIGIPVMLSISKNQALVGLLELDINNAKTNNFFNLYNTLSIALSVLGIVLFIAYPFYVIGEKSYSALSIINENPWVSLFAIFPLIYFIGFCLKNKALKVIVSSTTILSLISLLVAVGAVHKEALIYPYYYGYIVYPFLLTLLIYKNSKK
ncbi:MAG: QueT transporter family protein [Anaeroplasma sp.]